jgi:hypothetical protein
MYKTGKDGIVKVLIVTLLDRLHSNTEFMAAVGASISEALSKCQSVIEEKPCAVAYHELPIAGSPFDCESPPRLSGDDVSDYCNKMIGDEIGHSIIMFSPRRSATVIALRSKQPNRFIDVVYRNLKEAASKQLSGTKPGVICVQLRHLPSDQLREIAASSTQSRKLNGMESITARLFDSEARNHVHTLAYVAPGSFKRTVSHRLDSFGLIRDTTISEDAISYAFKNKRHLKFCDPRYRVFE